MTIETTTDSSKELIIFKVTGALDFDEQMEVLKKFYGESPTKNVLWDFRKITGSRITSEQLTKIIQFIKTHDEKRISGKTALVVSELLDYGLARMGSIMAEVEETAIEICGFKNYDEALEWFDSNN